VLLLSSESVDRIDSIGLSDDALMLGRVLREASESELATANVSLAAASICKRITCASTALGSIRVDSTV
jgi:hypothetical protein